ncbi:MAG: hypothetical protein ACLFM1_06435 [Bacteroidales bacterium]
MKRIYTIVAFLLIAGMSFAQYQSKPETFFMQDFDPDTLALVRATSGISETDEDSVYESIAEAFF